MKESIIPSCLYLLFSMSLVLTRLILSTSLSNLFISLTGILCYLYMIFSNRIIRRRLISISCLYMLLMLVSRVYNKNADLPELIWNISFTGVAALFYYRKINITCMYVVFYIAVIYCIFLALKGYNIQDGLDAGGSINNISTLLIFLVASIYIEYHKINRNNLLPYLPVILTLIVSIWTASRAGILSLSILVLFVIFFNIREKKTSYIYVGILILMILLFSLKFGDIFYSNIIDKTDRYGTDSPRVLIWNEYFRNLNNLLDVFLGVEYNKTRDFWISFYDGNLHNSFLMLHSKYGLIGFVIMLLWVFMAFVKSLKSHDYIYLFILITVCARAFFDWCAFPGIFDVLFWFYVFYVIDNKKQIRIGNLNI